MMAMLSLKLPADAAGTGVVAEALVEYGTV